MEKLIFKFIKQFPRFFSFLGIKDLQPDIPDIRDDVMGQDEPRFKWKVLKKDGDWIECFKNIDWEVQNDMDCTGHAIKNIIEMLAWVKWNEKWEISEAYINGMAGTSKWQGNSMRKILDTVRKYGWVEDKDWPVQNRWKPIPQYIINKGQAKLEEYNFGYDAVLATENGLNTAIQYSPLYVGGSAWLLKNNVYVSFGNPNHCFTELKNTDKIAGDSYKPHIKDLAENFKLYYVRRIYLGKKVREYNKEWFDYLIDKRRFKYLQRTDELNGGRGQVYEIFKYGYKELNEQEKKEIGIAILMKRDDATGISEKDYYNLFI